MTHSSELMTTGIARITNVTMTAPQPHSNINMIRSGSIAMRKNRPQRNLFSQKPRIRSVCGYTAVFYNIFRVA